MFLLFLSHHNTQIVINNNNNVVKECSMIDEYQNIFIPNKYTNTYFNIIRLAQQRKLDKNTYYENHHIIPRSIEKSISKESWNIISLTAREHFLCHKLLVKMTTGSNRSKMVYALWGLTNQHNKNQLRKKPSARDYQLSKELLRETLSRDRKGKSLEELYGLERAQEIKNKLALRPPKKNSIKEIENFSNMVKYNHSIGVYKNTGFNGRKLPRKTCVYCNREFDIGNHNKYHGEKCKLRKPSE